MNTQESDTPAPGPYRIGWEDGSGPESIVSEDGDAIARVRWGCGCCEDRSPLTDREKATVRLLAAAWEMRDMLRELESELDSARRVFGIPYSLHAVFTDLRNFLRRVEGEE